MNLDRERTRLIQALSHEGDRLLVHDKCLRFRVKDLILAFNKTGDSIRGSEALTPSEELVNLFDSHGPSLIRALVSNLHLLISDNKIERQFDQIAEKLGEYLVVNADNTMLLLEELNKYASSHNETVEKFIGLLIAQIELTVKEAGIVFHNHSFTYSFRLLLFRQLAKKTSFFPVLCKHLSDILKQNHSDDYFKYRVLPLIRSYITTQEVGLNYLLDAFICGQLEKSISIVISHFGDNLFKFIEKRQIKPDSKLLYPLFYSLKHIQDRSNKDRLIKLLINTWANDLVISAKLKRLLGEKSSPSFYQQFNDATVDLIKDFARDSGSQIKYVEAVGELYKRVLENNTQAVLSSIQQTTDGNIPAAVLNRIEEEQAKLNFYLAVKKSPVPHSFLKTFIKKVCSPKYYERLSEEIQEDIISDYKTYQYLSIDKLESIKRCGKNSRITDKILGLMLHKRENID